MKTRTKIALWIISVAVGIILVAAIWLLSYNPGGMRSTYPAKDNDPRLLVVARSITPVIDRIDAYRTRTGKLPATTEDADAHQPDPSSLYYIYTIDEDHYLLWIKLGWDPSLVFNSKDRSWTFVPGDGSPEKRIKLDAEPPDTAAASRGL